MEAKPVVLDPPKDDPITVEDLAQYNGTDPSKPIYVAIKGAQIAQYCLLLSLICYKAQSLTFRQSGTCMVCRECCIKHTKL